MQYNKIFQLYGISLGSENFAFSPTETVKQQKHQEIIALLNLKLISRISTEPFEILSQYTCLCIYEINSFYENLCVRSLEKE